MSFYDNGMNNNQAPARNAMFNFPQGSMNGGATPFNNNSMNNNTYGGDSGNGMGIAPDPLPSGIINALSTRGYAHEPPLLEEIGINFDHIFAKTKIVLTPTSVNNVLSQEILDDSDFAGPLIFFMLFGLFLLLAGKAHFGYIYGVALFGTLSLHYLSKLMASNTNNKLQFFTTASILGYCFLPLCFLTLIGVFHTLDNTWGYILAFTFVVWSTWSASGFLNSLLQLQNARALIAYPLAIFYSVFALMAIFV
ncbi:protein transport protein Yip1p [Monosporozyma unispora]|nr:transporter yip1 [Kazachstania unispora]